MRVAPSTILWARPGSRTTARGCINLLTPARTLSKYATGMTTEHCLVQVEKWNGR